MKKLILLSLSLFFLVTGLKAQQVEISTTTASPLKIESTNSAQNWVGFYNSSGYQGYTGLFFGATDMDFGTGGSNTTGKVHLVTSATPKLTVIPNGNVGIGVLDPDAKLEVDGQINITGGSPGAGKVLVGDANGLASWSSSLPPVTYAIGDFAQGGVVFWVSPNGEHGKVVSVYDVGPVFWSNIATTAIGVSAQSDINGAGNTVSILMQSGHTNSAAQHCADLAYGGYDDWYLPSIDELSVVYSNRFVVNETAVLHGGEVFADASYWSSTESNQTLAWRHLFLSLGPNASSKGSANIVRAIRAF